MSAQDEVFAAPRVPLRYLARINPGPPRTKKRESCYLPMEAISEFGPVDTSRVRPTSELARGYSCIADGDVAYAKVTPCFENGKGLRAIGLPGGYAFATTEVTVLRPKEDLDCQYLAWVLQSEDFRAPGVSRMSGAGGLKRVPESYAASYRVPCPRLAVQRAIADYLDRETAQIDAFIAKDEELITLLTERRAATIAKAVTGGTSNDVTRDRAGARTTWRNMRLSWLFRSTASGTTPPAELMLDGHEADVWWVTTGELRERRIEATARGITRETLAAISALRVHPAGSLLLAMYGATIGRTGTLGVPAASNQAVCALSGPIDCSTAFVEYALLAARERLLLEAVGGGQPNINQETVRSFRIGVPSLVEQEQIVSDLHVQVARIDAATETARQAIALARERRAALISAAVTGKIDIPTMNEGAA